MAEKNLKLETLINTKRLRQELTMLAGGNDGDGSSPEIRAKVLNRLKHVSEEGRNKARDLLFEDGNGTACARRISHLQDEIIRVIYDFATTHVYRVSNVSEAEKIAVTAVGGYGRGTLAPGSDIDLLFLLPYKQTAWGEQVVEYMLYMLWDMGFKVGHATRNIDECIRLSKQDMTIRTSILEVRYLYGDKELFETLTEQFSKQVVAKKDSEFINAKLAERDERHMKSGASRYLVEPNVKDGKGGLRDLHTLFWIGKYFYNLEKSHALVGAGMLTEKQYRRFSKAEKFLWTVRCHMHFLTGRAEERLSFDIQREIAERLHYVDHPGLSAVERFMKHYFLVAKEVGDLTLIACAKLEEQQRKKVFGFNRLIRSVIGSTRKLRGSTDFVIENGRINTANEAVFRNDPLNLIRFFVVAEEAGLDFHPDAVELLSASLSLVGPEMRKAPEANALFLKLLTSGNSERMLRRMNETGFLGKFIPAFGKVVAMMQFNMYHHYTVDEHLIRSIGVLAAIENGQLADEHPLAHELVTGMADTTLLYVALFLHDIAKGRKEDHSIAGERVARQICPRLGLDKEQTALVAWLVREHLTMSMIAQSRDLSDRKTIEDFADVVQEVDRMRHLVVLTVCDIRAVGPGVWNGWKGQLLRTLYYETELMLNGGFSKIPLVARVEYARQELAQALSAWPEADREKYTNLPYSAYFLSTSLETQIRHMNFLREIDLTSEKLATTVHTKQFEAITEITVVAPDYPRLLSIIAGACAAAGGDIEDAKIHTTSDGRALDSIFIRRKYDLDADEIRRAERIGNMIEEVLSGKTSLPKVIERDNRPMRRQRAFSVTPKITVNNDLSDTFTVIEIECLDRPGLLSDLTAAIADLNLDIGSAHVVTFGEKANDSFYVRDLVGHKITNGNRIKKIITVLTQVMAPTASKEAA